MSTLICGSIAYDNIMVFHDHFKNHILPEQIHILNVAFLVPEMRREFGGCAGNIAYNLKLLGGEPLIMATVGDDVEPYLAAPGRPRPGAHPRAPHRRQLHRAGLHHHRSRRQPDHRLPPRRHELLAPQPRRRRRRTPRSASSRPTAATACCSTRASSAAGIPFIFDPGQGLPMFNGDELLDFVDLADYACFNDYEAKLLCERTGSSLEQLAGEVKALIVTLGGEGSQIYADGNA